MPRITDFDHAYSIFQAKGLDLADRNDDGIPSRINLQDYLKEGVKNLLEKRQEGVTFTDAIATPDIAPWMPQVMQRRVLEAQEPLIVLTGLFEPMSYQAGQQIEFPAIGALEAADLAEMQEPPEVRLIESGATVTAKVGKVGVKFRLSQETLAHSSFDVFGLHLDACAKALVRHKEVKASNFINALGVPIFDNFNPSASALGVTHGRDLAGAGNGTLILDDLFDAMAQVMMQGFSPDTLIMHPLTYIMFLKDKDMRAIALAGGNQLWFGGWTGNPATRGPGSGTHVSGGQRVLQGTPATGEAASTIGQFNQTMTSAPMLPSHWPWPLRIVVSPFIPYDPSTKRTNIMVCDSRELGYYIEDYPVRTTQWDEPNIDVSTTKLVEAYSFHIKNEGLGVGILKNVKVAPNEVVLPAQSTLSVSGSVQEIPATTPV